MSCEKYKTKQIQETECIGDSLDTFNNNFNVLRGAYCDIREELAKRLRIMNQSVALRGFSTVIDFSGTRVTSLTSPTIHPYESVDALDFSGIGKTVYIPITGVTRIIAGQNVTIESDSVNPGQGYVTVNFELPPRPKQTRTFFYFEDGKTNATNKPSMTRVQNFLNEEVKLRSDKNLSFTNNTAGTDEDYRTNRNWDVSRPGDEAFVIYYKTYRNEFQIAPAGSLAKSGYNVTGGMQNYRCWGKGGRRGYSAKITGVSGKSYTISWPSDTAKRSVLVVITYKFVFNGVEYIPVTSDVSGSWPKYSYGLRQASTSRFSTVV
jgi:hypothetical protein